MIDSSEKRKRRFAFDLHDQSSCVFEKRSKTPIIAMTKLKGYFESTFKFCLFP